MDYAALAKQFGGALHEQPVQQAAPDQPMPDWFSGLSPKDQADVRMKMYQEGRTRLADLQKHISDAGPAISDLEQFGQLNRKNSTGSLWQNITPDSPMLRSEDSQRMAAITARLAPQQRPTGSGSSSDRDVSLFLKGLPSIQQEGPTNKGIREDFMRQYQNAIDKSNAMQEHLQKHGNLLDFDARWAQRGIDSNKADKQSAISPGGWSASRVK